MYQEIAQADFFWSGLLLKVKLYTRRTIYKHEMKYILTIYKTIITKDYFCDNISTKNFFILELSSDLIFFKEI